MRPKIRAEWVFVAGLACCAVGIAHQPVRGAAILGGFACLLLGLYLLGD